MKKSWIILAALGLCACASVNKNTVSYQMSKYDQQVYYVIAGEGDTKSAAAADARMNMRKNIELNVVDAKEIAQVEDLLANAKIVKTWRDKSQSQNKHYLSLAVLKRATAQKILEAPINDTDAQLGALATQLQATEDKFAGLRAAFAMDPLIAKRNILEDFKVYKPHCIPAVPRLYEVFRNKIIEGVRAKKKWALVSFIMNNQKLLRAIGLGKLVNKVLNQIRSVFGGRARLLVAGGAATKPEVEKFYESLGITFVQGYGMTETVGPFCCSRPSKHRVPFAFGTPIGCSECTIRDADEKGIGTLWVRGPNIFNGYLNNKEANADSFDKDGWFNTGDLVYLDKNKQYHFAGRKKQVIVLDSGKNVYPDELEALFMEIDGVKNVAVFEHKENDKTVTYAVFQVEKGMSFLKLAASVALANRKVAPYKWVTHFAMTTDDLPMTSTQKVKHHEVRQNLIDGKYPENTNKIRERL